MTQNEFYRQIVEQTGEDYQTIERLGFTPVVPKYRYFPRQRRRHKRPRINSTPLNNRKQNHDNITTT